MAAMQVLGAPAALAVELELVDDNPSMNLKRASDIVRKLPCSEIAQPDHTKDAPTGRVKLVHLP